jgi:hypothetical protein
MWKESIVAKLYGGTKENHEILSDDIDAPAEILIGTSKVKSEDFPLEINCSVRKNKGNGNKGGKGGKNDKL